MEAAHETQVAAETFNAFVVEGVAHPQGCAWGVDDPITVTSDETVWTIIIANSNFRVIAEPAPITVKSPQDEINAAKNQALSMVRTCLNAMGFHLGRLLHPEITGGYVPPNGILVLCQTWPGVASSKLEGLRIPGEELAPVNNASYNSWHVRLAVADICQATDSPDDTVYLSYRAIETLRQHYAQPEDKSRDASWERMRAALGLDRSEIDALVAKAKSRRHGDPLTLTEQDRIEAILLAKTAVVKFIEHLGH